MGHAGSPQVSNAKPEDMYDLLRPNVMKDIAGGDRMSRVEWGPLNGDLGLIKHGLSRSTLNALP
jgi:hypothetical protein